MSEVTVVIPFLNAADTILDAVRSVFAQRDVSWKLVLLDDGSVDGSLEKVRRIRDPRIVVVSDDCNRGLAYRLNQAPSLVDTEFLARMDADDVMLPNRLATQLKWLRQEPKPHVVGTHAYVIDRALQVRSVRGPRPWIGQPTVAHVLRSGFLIHPTVCGRTDWFAKNPYDTAPAYLRAEDLELWCRTAEKAKFEIVPEPLLFYREGATSPRNYVLTCEASRRILRTYGPKTFGELETLGRQAYSWVKQTSYRVAFSLDGAERMMRRRSRALTFDERTRAQCILDEVLGVAVPGV